MTSLKGKTLFISGASRGIGLAIGLAAAREGANVAIAAKTAEPHPKLEGTVFTAAAEIEKAHGAKGMVRRLELACILAVDPEVWLLDEPQSGLDPAGIRLLREICTEARGRGRTLVVTSHSVTDAIAPCVSDSFSAASFSLVRTSLM